MQNNKFKSNLCKKPYCNELELGIHKARHLKEDFQNKCSSCDFKAVAKLDIIIRHTQSHAEKELYQCTYCYKNFKRDSNLKEHIKVVHAKDGGYECQLCKFSTLRRSSLYSHMKSHDDSFIECICPICGSKFKSKATFKYHLLSHADAKSFICKVCGKMFTMASRLRRHEIHVHGPKNFECSICHKTFPTVHHRNRHNLTHTGDKPYSCYFCPHSSSTQGNIVKHIKLIHGKIEECNKYVIKKTEDNGSKTEKLMDQNEVNYLKAKGKDIAVAFLNVLNMKGLSKTTLDQLNEKKKNNDQHKMTELQKKIQKLANSRKNNSKKNCDVNIEKKEESEKKSDLELPDATVLEDDYFIQHVEEVVENDSTIILPAAQTIQITLNKSEIATQLQSEEPISSRSVEQIKNIKQIKQLIVDINSHLSHTSVDIQENGSKMPQQTPLRSSDALEDFDHIEYSNMVFISQEEFVKNGKCNTSFQESEHLSCQDSVQNNHRKLLGKNEKVYILSKDNVLISDRMESSKNIRNRSSHCKRKKQNSSKLKKGLKYSTLNNEISLKYKNLRVDNHNHILSPLLINNNNNSVRINTDTSVKVDYNKTICNDKNSLQGSKLDHMYYNFKIVPYSTKNVSMTESDDLDLTVNQVKFNGQHCVVLDAGKSRYFNDKNIVDLYVTESSDFVSENYVIQLEKDFRVPGVYVPQVYESTSFLPENELCYHLLNLGSDNISKLSHERTPTKLQINIEAEDNNSVPYVLLDHTDKVKDFEKITINDTFNQVESSNEDVNLESIAEIEETSNSEVTFHIVNDC